MDNEYVAAFRSYSEAILDAQGNIDFHRIFQSADGTQGTLPVKLEICSGAGEWAVSQVSECLGRHHVITKLVIATVSIDHLVVYFEGLTVG